MMGDGGRGLHVELGGDLREELGERSVTEAYLPVQ
jgi:hypothetical protein